MAVTYRWDVPQELGRGGAEWYPDHSGHRHVVTLSSGAFEASVYCDGIMKVYCTECAGGDNVIRYPEDWAKHGYHSDAEIAFATEQGSLDWHNNPWFDVYDGDGNHLDMVADSVGAAVANAREWLAAQR